MGGKDLTQTYIHCYVDSCSMSFPREQTYSILLMWEQRVQILAWLSLKCLSLLCMLNCENSQGKSKKDFLLITSPAQACAFSEKEVFQCCFLADSGWRVCSSTSLYLLLGRKKTCLPRIGHFQKNSFVFLAYGMTVKIVKMSGMKCTCQLRGSSMTPVLLTIIWKPLGFP